MNIFIMILMAMFMMGYFLMDSPNQKVQQQETQYAITQSDLRTIAQCATAMHNAQINGTEFQDGCVTQNGIESHFICLNDDFKITNCDANKKNKEIFRYIVTITAPIDVQKYNNMMEILEEYYADSSAFGLLQDNAIMAGGTTNKKIVPDAIAEKLNLQNGQLVYLTHYETPDTILPQARQISENIVCPTGTIKTFRFGRWQCVAHNTKTDCGGDMIWDSGQQQCVPDESRKPLCASNQNAVIVDDIWECVSPFDEKTCPNNMVARLNYNTLEWECVEEPDSIKDTTKCSNLVSGGVYGKFGTTLRLPQTSCTECEKAITDPETCVTKCVPDVTKLENANCYPDASTQCSGPTRAIYFGFPSREYIANTDAVTNIAVPLDNNHSQNRKFNCMDCGTGVIDTEKSVYPFVAICK